MSGCDHGEIEGLNRGLCPFTDNENETTKVLIILKIDEKMRKEGIKSKVTYLFVSC